MVMTANGKPPPILEQIPVSARTAAAAFPIADDGADHLTGGLDAPVRTGAALNASLIPRVEAVWAATLLLSVWALAVEGAGIVAVGLIALFATAALAWTV